MTPREQIEKASEAFTEAYLSDSQDFLACEKHHRKLLLTMDLYEVEDVHEKAMKAGYNLAIENVVEWLLKNTCERYNKSAYADVKCENCVSQEEFINNLKQAMKL